MAQARIGDIVKVQYTGSFKEGKERLFLQLSISQGLLRSCRLCSIINILTA
ncbi:MAG: hypothetical protein P8075_01585 [Deltaproteobacteria bacterium]|jgi:hypothetical protein